MGASCCTLAASHEEQDAGKSSRKKDNDKKLGDSSRNNTSKTLTSAPKDVTQLAATLFDRNVHRSSIAVLLEGVGALPSCTPESWTRDIGITLTESLFRFQALMSSATPKSSSGILVQELQYFIAFSNDASLWIQSSNALSGILRDEGLLQRSPSPAHDDDGGMMDASRDDMRADESEGGLGDLFDRSALIGGGGSATAAAQRKSQKAPTAAAAATHHHGRMKHTTTAAASWEDSLKVFVTAAQRHRHISEEEKLHYASMLTLIGRKAASDGNLMNGNGETSGPSQTESSGFSILTLPSFRSHADGSASPASSSPSGNAPVVVPQASTSWNTVVFTSHPAALKDRQRLGTNITACQEGVLVEGIIVRWNAVTEGVTGGEVSAAPPAVFHDRQDWHWQTRLRDAPVAAATRTLLQRVALISR
jgi:hypothetical protein